MFGFSRDVQTRSFPAPGTSRGLLTPGWMQREESIMGTAIHVELWSDDVQNGVRAIDAVMREMHRIDHAMSPYKTASELSRINREAAKSAVSISAEMFSLLERAQAFSELSNGAFDLSYAAVGRLYDYRLGKVPSANELHKARQVVGEPAPVGRTS